MIGGDCTTTACARECGIPHFSRFGQLLFSVRHGLNELTREAVIAHRPSPKAPYRNAMSCKKVMTTRLSKSWQARVRGDASQLPLLTRLQFHFPIWIRCISTLVIIIIHIIYREELSIYNGYMAINSTFRLSTLPLRQPVPRPQNSCALREQPCCCWTCH